MKSRRVTPPKPKQIDKVDIVELVILAKAAGKHTDKDIALWIISVSGYWRLKGYDEIMKELSNG